MPKLLSLFPRAHECYLFSHIRLFAIPWTVAHQAPLSMEFFRQGYWKGLPFPPPGVIPELGIEPESPALHADSFPVESLGKLAIIPTKMIHVCMGHFERGCNYLHYLHHSLASGQITGKECSPANQQKIVLKIC